MITAAQNGLYWLEFRAAKKVLVRRGFSDADAEVWRHQVHADVTGRDVASHYDLGRKTEFDGVLDAFRAVSVGSLPRLDGDAMDGFRQRIAAALATLAPSDPAAYRAAMVRRLRLPESESAWSVRNWVALVGSLERSARSRRRSAGPVPK